ncbi:MAG TPA: adenylate/guanylate cyclase domain-containing protein [Myxococcota bacterium]|jgi:class 3 adenylate cyclase|nr:adenylate/guanylate cyclase domain-containing protein [Myxococcota bacterium]
MSAADPDARADEARRKILYVDDERENLDAFWRRFRRDYDVVRATSGEEALALLGADGDIPVLITDQRMPGMTGVQLLERAAATHPDQVRIILTGYTDIDALIDAINTGKVYRYVSKPWDEAEMRITLRNAVESYDLRVQNKRLLDELRRQNEQLERRVADRTAELRTLNSSLEERVAAAIVETEQLRRLERYVSGPIARRLLDGGRRELGVNRKNLTVMFTDIRGFTASGETMEPEELIELLNEYLREMTQLVFAHEGTLDKFIGDAIMVFFGDPLELPDHAVRAVRLALAMQRRMEELQARWFQDGKRPWGMGIGINTGYMTVGPIGSEHRMEYTVIGNQVNLAARLGAQAGPGETLITNRTLGAVRDLVEVESVGAVQAKGISHPVEVYRVLRLKP